MGAFLAIAGLGLLGYALFSRKGEPVTASGLTQEEHDAAVNAEIMSLTQQNPPMAGQVRSMIGDPTQWTQQELSIMALNLHGLGYFALSEEVTSRMVQVYGNV